MKKNAVSTASLADYAAVINDAHRAAFGCAAQALEHARAAGAELLKVKAALKHGEFGPWIAEHLDFSERTAQGYMRVATNWTQVESKSATVADLTLRGALDALAKPKPRLDQKPPAPDTRRKPEQAIADDPAPDGSASGPVEPAKPAKPIKPAEVEKLQTENEELSAQLAELAKQQEPLQDEVTFLRKIEDEGDKLKEACAEVKRLQALVRVQEERIRGLMNEKNEAVRAAKMWKAKFEKAERAAA